MDYPSKPPFYAHKAVRLMHKSGLASEIGREAFCILVVVLHTEDAARYRGPVKFFNSQLMETLGFAKWETFDRARRKAIESGWLAYEGCGKRSAGKYSVVIPDGYDKINDMPIEEPDDTLSPANGYKEGYNAGYKEGYSMGYKAGVNGGIDGGIKRGLSGVQSGGNVGDNMGEPPTLFPEPTPEPAPTPAPEPLPKRRTRVRVEYTEDFERFWREYPSSEGKREAFDAFRDAVDRLGKSMVDSDPVDFLVGKARDYATFIREHPEKRSIKHGQGWLNGDRFESDYVRDLAEAKRNHAKKSTLKTFEDQRAENNRSVFDKVFGVKNDPGRSGSTGSVDGVVRHIRGPGE